MQVPHLFNFDVWVLTLLLVGIQCMMCAYLYSCMQTLVAFVSL